MKNSKWFSSIILVNKNLGRRHYISQLFHRLLSDMPMAIHPHNCTSSDVANNRFIEFK